MFNPKQNGNRPALTLLPLPEIIDRVPGQFWRPNVIFINELVQALQGRRVLEIFAGNGYLAGVLASRGIDIQATSILSSMDAHDYGIYHPVEDMDAVTAVHTYAQDADVLLMCWPTTTNQALEAADLWGDRPIVFIGEMTNYAIEHYGGCCTDEFFERFSVSKTFLSYQGSMMEHACIGELLPAPRDIHRSSFSSR